ncbi:hypothetical protein B0O99DRAFT_615592 [Bisporella sp. PMI_857]|nr:hypothetical protein B0O99DRAFT_615592 [Bisporella sp. PMI_857]
MDQAARNLLQPLPPLQVQNHHTRVNSTDGALVDIVQELKQLPKSGSRRTQRVVFLVLAAVLFMGVIGSVQYIRKAKIEGFSLQHSRPLQWKHCGNTSEEAVSNNCILDFIAGAWVPRECYDAELEEEFLKLRDWHWYADEAGRHEISKDIIKQNGGSNPIFVSIEYHWVHCAYTWKKLHRSRIRHTPIDTHISKYEHTVHCADGLANHDNITDNRPIARFYQHFESCQG